MKNYFIKVYTSDGKFLKDWSGIANFGQFSKEVNSGLGQCIIDLGVPFDYQGTELAVNNNIEILLSDKDTATNRYIKIYSGYISLINPYVEGSKEGIQVYLLGHYTKLSTDILKTNEVIIHYTDETDGLTITPSGTEADLGLVIRGIINRYRIETTNPMIFYGPDSIPLLEIQTLYVFRLMTYREAIDKVFSMLGPNYYWYINEDNLMRIRPKDPAPVHIFEFKKHFTAVDVKKSMEKVRNNMIVWNGLPETEDEIFKGYEHEGSIARYGRRTEIIIDNGITDESSADAIGQSMLDNNNEPNISIICEILDNNENDKFGYDIESINPGDTCRFVGFNSTLSEIFKDNMIITKIDYRISSVILTIEPVKSGLIDWQSRINKKVVDFTNANVPDEYDT